MHDGLHASLTEQIIGCAMEVHRHLGPGLLESIYESALCFELRTAGVVFKRQIGVPLFYKACCYRSIVPTSWSLRPLLSRLKPSSDWTGLHIGLILNFNSAVLEHRVRRVIL
jgi:hypothetical protein